MEDKIIEILKKEQFNITDEAGNAYNVVEEDDFKDIAEKIVKLFAIPVVMQRSELLLFADYSESDKTSQTTDECVDNYLAQKSNSA